MKHSDFDGKRPINQRIKRIMGNNLKHYSKQELKSKTKEELITLLLSNKMTYFVLRNKFMDLCLQSEFLARKVRVLTKNIGGEYLKAINKMIVDAMKKRGEMLGEEHSVLVSE